MTAYVNSRSPALLVPTCLVVACLAACAPAAPVDPVVLGTQIEAIRQETPIAITSEQVAETLALGTDATAVQRGRLREQLVGSVVEWDLTVYEVSLSESGYRVSSRTIPVSNSTALEVVSVHAMVVAESEADRARLEALRTDDVVRVRGRVNDVVLRSVVVLAPAVVVSEATRD